MQRSEQLNEFATAFAKAQGQIEDATKDRQNPHFRSSYADFASVREAIRLPLSNNGICYFQGVRTVGNVVEVETTLLHSSGQFIAETIGIPVQQMNAQTIGSAATYGKRYGLMGMVGIAASEDDDDGNKATERAPQGPPVIVSSGRPPAEKEPAVSSKAIAMAREIKEIAALKDIDSFKKTPEFIAFWGASNQTDRQHVIGAVERKKAQLDQPIIAAG